MALDSNNKLSEEDNKLKLTCSNTNTYLISNAALQKLPPPLKHVVIKMATLLLLSEKNGHAPLAMGSEKNSSH